MTTNTQDTLIRQYDLNLGTYYIYNKYIIAEIKEGVTITLGKLQDLIPIVQKHFGNGQPFTYLSNRINSHSIIPTDYLDCPFLNMENFKGYGVITYNLLTEKSTEIEKHFAQKPFYNFTNLQDAIEWSKEQISI
ncbi:hypothetical protein SAMN04487910_3366 [Aquimarina amphilecti]|uniref:STAS/SEC14 domain-containing protein n=1 Tax=Aquimarina amphilecti TaxID=1038014 RepID=A0A1H7TD90_AQUAM|nr:hypothetical protein [Aquimarina amphilecti]SEL82364.1 hypothetical protein SAMN04487910_3366 [Aquimarina amphilecti]